MNKTKDYSILVVDDESSNIMKLSQILNPYYTIYAAKNGDAAIKAAEKHIPDVILLDIIMPDMDGYMVIQVLKKSEKTKHIPVIFITGLSNDADEERGMALGAADYLIKPFSPALVKVRVLNQIKLIEQFRENEYDIMKYKLSNDALNIALWDMDVISVDPINPINKFIWSDEFRNMLGFTSKCDEFPDILQSWSDRLHPDDKEKTLNSFAAHINDYTGKTPFDVEYRLMLKCGKYRYFHALGTTYRDKDGVPIRVAGALMDITEKKHMEREIADSMKKIENDAHWYKSILDAISLPITVTDIDMKWTFVNRAVEEFLGQKRKDLYGKSCENWGSEICSTEKCGIFCAKRGIKRTFFEHKNSSYQVDVEKLKDISGNDAGHIEIVQDITNIKQLAKQQAEAEATSKSKSAFLANMSHEIRTPMNAISGVAEILAQHKNLPDDISEGLGRIRNSCDMLMGIINDILDFSKIEAGKLEIKPLQYNIASMINDSVQLNIMRMGEKPIEFEVQIDEKIPLKLIGDELRIKQILNNLLSNAFKYTEKGKVTLSGSFEYTINNSDSGTLLLSVEDTGMGMTKEQVDQMFDEYSRFNQKSGHSIEGTGLGMAITKRLINNMKGSIDIKSELHKGSIFTIRLPQSIVDSEVLGAKLAKNLRNYRTKNCISLGKSSSIIREHMPYGNVLIVDDVETNIYVAQGLMKPYGLKIETAMSGFEAIQKIEDNNIYDIIFMDHMMPHMDGIETTKHIRDLGYKEPIVALTANALVGHADMFLQNGFDYFISKPIDIRRLNSVLNKFVRDKQPPEVIKAAQNQVANDKSHSKSILTESFINDANKTITVLESFIDNSNPPNDEDLQKFNVHIHGIKSSLINIGEFQLSKLAQELETAGKEQNIKFITNSIPDFLQKLRSLAEKLKPTQEATDNAAENITLLQEKLSEIQKNCTDYNRKGVLDIIKELKQQKCSNKTYETLNIIMNFALNSEFEKAGNTAVEYVSVLNPSKNQNAESFLNSSENQNISAINPLENQNTSSSLFADKNVTGINIQKGLERYNGDEEVYLKILRSYAASVRTLLEKIKVFDENDIKNYGITVHGIKGASYDIFADKIGDSAKALEMAAKSEDVKYINENNGDFYKTAWELVNNIETLLSEVNLKNPKPSKDKPDEKILRKLLDACKIYDMDGVDEAMLEIEKYQYTSDPGITKWLRENVDLVNFSQIAEKLKYLEKW